MMGTLDLFTNVVDVQGFNTMHHFKERNGKVDLTWKDSLSLTSELGGNKQEEV